MKTLKKKQYTLTTKKEAEREGFVPVTTGYSKTEHWMLDNTITDLGNAPYRLVMAIDGIEIWRKRSDVKFTNGLKASWA